MSRPPTPALVFVHGLDQGDGSTLEDALRHVALQRGYLFHPFRWGAPRARLTLTGSAILGALGAIFDRTDSFEGVLRGAADAGLRHYHDARGGLPEAADRLRAWCVAAPRPYVCLGYSLGAEVVCRALAPLGSDCPRSCTRVVLAAGTPHPREVRALRVGLARPRIVNVWSASDGVLHLVRRLERRPRVAGLGPIAGVVNVEAQGLGHAGYAHPLVAAALAQLAIDGSAATCLRDRWRRA